MITPSQIGLAIGGAVILAMGIYIGVLRLDRSELKAENADLRAVHEMCNHALDTVLGKNGELASQIDVLTKRYDSATETMAKVRKADADALARADASLSKLRKDLGNAPASDDGPVAPIVPRVLDELRSVQAAVANR